MLNLEKFGGDVSSRRAAIAVPQRQDAAVGSPIAYEEVDYLGPDAWALLSAETQAWARGSAGEAIRDPHSGRSDEHWYCSVATDRRAGAPRTAGRTAEYVLVSFGKRGLAVSTGATANFVAGPGSTRWTSARFDVPVDPSQIRHDHRVAAGPTGGDPADPAAVSPFGGLLRPDFEARFGNLPAPTQLFLVQPFVASGRPPAEADLEATVSVSGHEYREATWTYLFNARWIAFAYSVRSVPYRSGFRGAKLWNESPEARSVLGAPWRVSAWVAPKIQSTSALVPG